MEDSLKNDWAEILQGELSKAYFLSLQQFLLHEYEQHTVYPAMEHIYNALHYTPYNKTRAVILGQDPYHGPNQAHGLSFSVPKGVKQPPSLKNILKELQDDLHLPFPMHGSLEAWAKQGVLLLNTVLTVRDGEPNSHAGLGWEQLTDEIIRKINLKSDPVAFVLWGKPAQQKLRLITNSNHLIITAPHPSPLSAHRGFFGSKPFSKINQWLKEQGRTEIDWAL